MTGINKTFYECLPLFFSDSISVYAEKMLNLVKKCGKNLVRYMAEKNNKIFKNKEKFKERLIEEGKMIDLDKPMPI